MKGLHNQVNKDSKIMFVTSSNKFLFFHGEKKYENRVFATNSIF